MFLGKLPELSIPAKVLGGFNEKFPGNIKRPFFKAMHCQPPSNLKLFHGVKGDLGLLCTHRLASEWLSTLFVCATYTPMQSNRKVDAASTIHVLFHNSCQRELHAC